MLWLRRYEKISIGNTAFLKGVGLFQPNLYKDTMYGQNSLFF